MVQVVEIVNYWNLQPYYFSWYCTECIPHLWFFPGVLDVRQSISACFIGAVRKQEEFLLDHTAMWSETWEKMIERVKDRNWGNIESAGTCQQNGLSYGCTSKNSIKFSLNTANGKMEEG